MPSSKYELDPSLTFEQAQEIADKLQAAWSAAGNALSAFVDAQGPRGPMNLTPDSVRLMPQYRTLQNELQSARVRAQRFGALYTRKFKKEIRDSVMARRKAMMKANQENESEQS
jgi:hypothetical protein